MSNKVQTATIRQLDIAYQAVEDELEVFIEEIQSSFGDWANSIGVRGENLPKRRAVTLGMVKHLLVEVKSLKDSFVLHVDRGA